MKYMNKIVSAVAAVMLSTAMLPSLAFADTSSEASSEAPQETRVVTWLSTEEQPEFDKTIIVNGVKYQLTGDPIIVETELEAAHVPATYTNQPGCWPADLNATMASIPEKEHVTQTVDGVEYAGDIALTNKTYAPVYETVEWEVNITQTYGPFATNDVSQLPSSYSYYNPESGNTLNLQRASVSWQASSSDGDMLPSSYVASVIFRGMDSTSALHHYEITANYAGEIYAVEPVISYEATLTYVGPEPVVEPEPEPVREFPVAAVVASVAAVAAAGGIIGGFYYRSRFRVAQRFADGKEKTVCRLPIRKEDGKLKVVLSGKVKMTGDGRYIGYMPNKWVKRGWPCRIAFPDGTTLTEGITQATYDLKAIVITAPPEA